MKHVPRFFFMALLLALVLVYGIGASRPIENDFNATTDCAEQCKENYDAMVKRCNELSGPRAERCRSAAQKQYDGCLERCKGGNAPSPGL
jgi:hypothetical protein